MSYKAIVLLKRKPEFSYEEFADWWLNSHKPLAMSLPNLKKMKINLSVDPDAVYDGASELWFPDEAAFKAAYDSEIGRSVAADSLKMVSKRNVVKVSEHEFVAE